MLGEHAGGLCRVVVGHCFGVSRLSKWRYRLHKVQFWRGMGHFLGLSLEL